MHVLSQYFLLRESFVLLLLQKQNELGSWTYGRSMERLSILNF